MTLRVGRIEHEGFRSGIPPLRNRFLWRDDSIQRQQPHSRRKTFMRCCTIRGFLHCLFAVFDRLLPLLGATFVEMFQSPEEKLVPGSISTTILRLRDPLVHIEFSFQSECDWLGNV